MNRLISLVSIIALGTVPILAQAGGYHWENNIETIHGIIVDSKQAAYDEGFDMIQSYQTKSSPQLRDELKAPFELVDRQSFKVISAKVTIDEFLQSNGQISYQPVLRLKYKYRMRESGNR
ncbi:DUF3316 domain-containing protein [Vibrio rotiferianus]|uniref:DUF3316 domain-containing protein n=1 Tax=Vibrio rotiferianus TaxID=190895 RepID=UPI00406A7F1C